MFCSLNALERVKNQVVAVVLVNILCLATGSMMGWLSPSLPLLMSAESPLDRPLTSAEAPWVGALSSLAAIFGTLLFGLLAKYIGTKISLLLSAIPMTSTWLWVYFASSAWHLYLARTSTGLALGGSFICIPLYVAELSCERIRGKLGSLMILFFNLGILVGYICGKSLDYITVPKVLILLPILFVVGFIFLPNTPQYLLKRNQLYKAEMSLRFYRNCYNESHDMERERQFQLELLKLIQIAEMNRTKPEIVLADFLTPSNMRAMLIAPFLMAVAQFSGTFTLISYAASIFRNTGSTVDPNTSTVVLGITQLIGTISATVLIDRLGRKKLLIVSTSLSAISLCIIATYTLFSELDFDMQYLNWVPVVTFSMFIFVSAIGITPVPYVIVSEVLPQKIRQIGATIGVCTVSVYAFIMLLIFPWLMDFIGLASCLYGFACVSLAGLIFTLFAVDETNGKNLDQLDHP